MSGSDPTPARRLDAPAFHRNHRAISAVLASHLGGATGDAVEIGSGSGQHVVAFAVDFPGLVWWPSDPLSVHRASIDAWRLEAGAANIRPAVAIDAAVDWRLGEPGMPPDRDLAAVVCINVLHVAPWAVAEGLLAGAGRHLAPHGRLFVYGPFTRDGVHTAPSNAAFDASLRAADPAWGVRDVGRIETAARDRGLRLLEIADMPANNLTLVLAPGDRAETKPEAAGM
jgi:SAM-dependent methyltransferase